MLFVFFFNDTATTEIYTLSLHDALPISFTASRTPCAASGRIPTRPAGPILRSGARPYCSAIDRKSTRLNSSHVRISYAVFCLKKKRKRIHVLRCSVHDDHTMSLFQPDGL